MDVNRRKFLAGAASFVVGNALSLGTAGPAQADQSCGPLVFYNGGLVRECSVGFRVSGVTARQRCDQWCWAACIEAAFGLYGYRVPQETIVAKIFGSRKPCRPSVGPGIARAINGSWNDKKGKKFRAQARVHLDLQFGVSDPFALGNASRYLATNVPVIVGALGHATLMTGMAWLEDNYGRQQLESIVVRDPWPGNKNRRVLTPQELYGTMFMAAVLVTRR